MAWGLPGLNLDKGDAPTEQLRKLAKNRFAVGTPDQVVEALIGTDVLPEIRRRIAAGE